MIEERDMYQSKIQQLNDFDEVDWRTVVSGRRPYRCAGVCNYMK